jgi:hypothetical protein
MAIKGKGRTRTRQVTRGPRPAYTPPPVPWYARRWVQVVGAFLLGLLAAALFAWVRGNLERESRDRARQREHAALRTVMLNYQGRLTPALGTLGQAQGQFFLAFPRLGQTIDGLGQSGPDGVSKREALEASSSTRKAAASASEALSKIDTAAILADHRGLPGTFTRDVSTSKSEMSHAVTMYEQSAILLGRAAEAPPSEAKDLLASAKELQTSADTLFADGYNAYVNAQTAAGTFQPTQPTGIPGAGGLPGGVPGGIPGAGAPAPQPGG